MLQQQIAEHRHRPGHRPELEVEDPSIEMGFGEAAGGGKALYATSRLNKVRPLSHSPVVLLVLVLVLVLNPAGLSLPLGVVTGWPLGARCVFAWAWHRSSTATHCSGRWLSTRGRGMSQREGQTRTGAHCRVWDCHRTGGPPTRTRSARSADRCKHGHGAVSQYTPP
jgi:hypothetical protein